MPALANAKVVDGKAAAAKAEAPKQASAAAAEKAKGAGEESREPGKDSGKASGVRPRRSPNRQQANPVS